MGPPRHTRVLVIAVLLLASTTVESQQRRFGRRGPTDELVFLLAIPEVQSELRLTTDQRQLLEDLQADLRDQRRGLFRRRLGGPGESDDGESRFDEMRRKMLALNKQGTQLVKAVLEPKQANRLEQLRLQREGVRAIDRPEFVEALGLTATQLSKIRQLGEVPPGSDTEAPLSQLSPSQRMAIADVIMTVLSEEQKARWEKLKGDPFAFPDWLSQLGRRGSRDRQRNGGRGARPGR